MTATQSLKIYELLNSQFQKPEISRQLTEAIEAVIDEKVQDGNKTYETLLHKAMQIMRADLKTELGDLAGQLRTEMREQKAEMIKWMFIFWIGQIGATIGIILLFVKK